MSEAQFDIRHLIALYQRGLINELPIELGPMPSFDLGPRVAQELLDWNVIDSHGQLTPSAQDIFGALASYEWALWGIVLLYNERQEIVCDLSDELLQYGVQYALRDVPRVTFLIGYKQGAFTTATMAGGKLAIATDRPSPAGDEQLHLTAADILLAIMDPTKRWKPYPMEEISIPAALAETLKRDLDADADEVEQSTREGLTGASLSRTTIRTLTELLAQRNVASTQVVLTRRTPLGKRTAKGSAAGILFFDGDTPGVVVSYPTRSFDGRGWITYEPATRESVSRSVAALHKVLNRAADADTTLR